MCDKAAMISRMKALDRKMNDIRDRISMLQDSKPVNTETSLQYCERALTGIKREPPTAIELEIKEFKKELKVAEDEYYQLYDKVGDDYPRGDIYSDSEEY